MSDITPRKPKGNPDAGQWTKKNRAGSGQISGLAPGESDFDEVEARACVTTVTNGYRSEEAYIAATEAFNANGGRLRTAADYSQAEAHVMKALDTNEKYAAEIITARSMECARCGASTIVTYGDDYCSEECNRDAYEEYHGV